MNYNNRYDNGSTAIMRIACAVAFIVFTFCYLFFSQSYELSVVQHVLSEGQTVYSPMVGALLITTVLFLVKRLVNMYFKVNKRYHWMTYVPSILLLTILTDMSPDIDQKFTLGIWIWVAPTVLAVWFVCIFTVRSITAYEADINSHGLFSRLVWINLFALGIMIMSAGLISGGNDTFHYRAKMEVMMNEHMWDKAAEVGKKSLAVDTSLTMLRCYALARESRLGDEMFKYAVTGNSESMLPMGNVNSRMLLYPVDSVYRFLGAKPFKGMKAKEYLKGLEKSGYKSKATSDYILCGLLIDRDIDGFVKELSQRYTINDSLPLHYREALIMYTRMRSKPYVVYHNQLMDTDFDDLQKLEESQPDQNARRLAVFDQYYGTYWWYYEYGEKGKPVNQ